jgi:hypothetical protein
MDEIFENILPLLPILVILAFRFIFSKKRRAGARGGEEPALSPRDTGNEAGQTPNAALREEFREEPYSGVNVDYEDDGGPDEEFSAWDLPVNSEVPPPEPEELPPPPVKTEIFLPVIEEAEVPSPSPEKSKPVTVFSGNLARLSPLRQAVVWAEILGSPKGLQF